MSALQLQVEEWVSTINTNQWLVEKQLEGLSHEDTMLELPFRGNRLNWVVGHLAEHRDWMLRAMDCTTLMPAKEAMMYRRGSEPLMDDSDAVAIETLLGYLRQTKTCLENQLQSVSDDFLMEIPTTGILLESHRDKTRLQRIKGLQWHETYHMGQLELLRQLAGTDDAILK